MTTASQKIDLKSKIKLKRKKLYDEYVLTNKHIICKFKYLILCFDHPESSESAGLVNIGKERLSELFDEQNIQLNSELTNGFFFHAVKDLQNWHPQISKIDIDCKNLYGLDDLNDYQESWPQIKDYLIRLPKNNCVKSDQDFDVFINQPHKVLDIKIYFRLLKKIKAVEDYRVNFNYLHELFIDHSIEWNSGELPYLDEVSVSPKDLPFAKNLNYPISVKEETYCVYPYVHLIPLNKIDGLNFGDKFIDNQPNPDGRSK